MKQTIFILTLLIINLQAATINEVVALTMKNNLDLKNFDIRAKNKSLESIKQSIWSDPILGVGVNDIQLKSPFKRTLEPMQTQYITISQIIPTSGKLELKESISKEDAKIEMLKKEEFKRVLISKIKELSYSYLIVEKKLNILKQTVKNLKKQKKVLKYLYENSKIDQLKLFELDTKMQSLKIKMENLNYQKEQFILAVKKLSFTQINHISGSLRVKKFDFGIEQAINSHPTIKVLKHLISKKSLQTKLESAKNTPDIKVGAGYFARSGFEDYVSINFSMPLKLSDREDISIKQKKLEKNELILKLKSTKHQMHQDIKNLLLWLKKSRKNIYLIDKKLLGINSQKEEVLKIYEEQKGISSLKTLQNSYKRFQLKLLKLDEKMLYFKAYSKLSYYMEPSDKYKYAQTASLGYPKISMKF